MCIYVPGGQAACLRKGRLAVLTGFGSDFCSITILRKRRDNSELLISRIPPARAYGKYMRLLDESKRAKHGIITIL